MKIIMKFAGSWKNLSEEEVDEIKKSINELRKKSTYDLLEQSIFDY